MAGPSDTCRRSRISTSTGRKSSYDMSIYSLSCISNSVIQWHGMSKQDQDNFVSNIVGHLGAAKSDVIKKRQAELFAKVDPALGQRIARGVGVTL